MEETKADVARRLIHTKGGYLLVAGEIEFPKHLENHEQLIIWDDSIQDWQHKEVPSNTRAIFYNIWISHQKAKRLRLAAQKLHIPVFPMQTKKELIRTINDIFYVDEPITAEQHEAEEQINSFILPGLGNEGDLPDNDLPDKNESAPAILMKEDVMRPPNRGEIPEILPKEISSNYDTINAEARRLVEVLKSKYNIKTSVNSVAQQIYVFNKKNGHAPIKSVSKPHGKKSVISSELSDFAETKKMLLDARAALDLVIDFMPKLEKEMMVHRGRADKLRKLLLGEE